MRCYTQWDHEAKFRYAFAGCESITETHSQAYQDIFALTMFNGKRNGEYFEIGANVPDYTNNTYLLSKNFDWNGTSIDFIGGLDSHWRIVRPQNRFVQCDALTANYEELIGSSRAIDYLQLDIEPCTNTLTALKRIPHDKYRFGFISFETDLYTGGQAPQVREESRQYLTNLGYTLIIPDVIVDNTNPYEDWWVDLDLVNRDVALSIKEMAKQTQKPFELLFTK
jgi:hypothetical protein